MTAPCDPPAAEVAVLAGVPEDAHPTRTAPVAGIAVTTAAVLLILTSISLVSLAASRG
jgi:hypothetical protein